MEKTRIVVVGSCNTDLVISVDHLPAPGETIIGHDFMTNQGGKGANQAVAVARLGGTTAFVARVGDDGFGRQSIALLKEEGIDTRHVLLTEGVATGVAMIPVDCRGENSIIVASGANALLSEEDIEAARPMIARAGTVLMQLEVPEAVNVRAAEIASATGVKIILNPAPARVLPSAIAGRIFLFTPNEFEESALGEVGGEVVTTLGAKGCRIRSTGEIVPAPPTKAVDSTGAGDTFNGVLAVRLAEGAPLRDACIAANEAAAKSVAVRYVLPSIPHRISNQTENRKC